MPTSLCTLCFLATWSWSCAQPVPCGSQVSCTLWSCSGLFTGLQLHPGAFDPSLCQLQREWNPELPAQKWSSLVLPRSHPTHARPRTPKGIALAQAKLHTGSTAPAPFHGARRVPVDPLHCAIPRPVSWCMGPPWSRYKLRGGEQRPSPISQCMVSLRPHYTGHTKRSTPSPILGAGGSVPPAPPRPRCTVEAGTPARCTRACHPAACPRALHGRSSRAGWGRGARRQPIRRRRGARAPPDSCIPQPIRAPSPRQPPSFPAAPSPAAPTGSTEGHAFPSPPTAKRPLPAAHPPRPASPCRDRPAPGPAAARPSAAGKSLRRHQLNRPSALT